MERVSNCVLLALLITAASAALLSQSQSMPKFTELPHQEREQLDRQRAVVASAAKARYGTPALTKTKVDLAVLQRLIDDRVFSRSQTYELQCLGVAFGDILASELPLHWVMVTDEYGTDPTLLNNELQINVNALTMISKRIEKGQPVNLKRLLRITREHLSGAKSIADVQRPPAAARKRPPGAALGTTEVVP